MNPELAYNLAFTIASALLYLYVGTRLGQRKLEDRTEQSVWNSLRAVWFAQGGRLLISSFSTLLAFLGVLNLYVHVGLGLVVLLALVVTLWGLLTYLVFLYTGRQRYLRPILLFYALFFFYLLVTTLIRQPQSVELDGAGASIRYANEAGAGFGLIFLGLLILPQLIASLFLLRLVFRLPERTQKYRALLVAATIFVWFGSAMLGVVTPIGGQPWWSTANQLIGLATAVLIYWAYYPPAILQKRLRISAIE